jgi:ferric-dicitrate binding protein FerR (iron transport regulator)
MDQNRTWILMARRLASEATPEEMLELERLLGEHPQYQLAFELTQAYWNQHPDTPLTEHEIEVAVDRILHTEAIDNEDTTLQQWEIAQRRRRRLRRRGALVGALAALLIILGVWAVTPTKTRPSAPATAKVTEVQTRMGTRTNLLLPDGTSVWLNAGSSLTYPTAFSGPNREVELEGEAFFDVASNPQHPFIVHASSVNIRVLGTSFDVKAYRRDKTMETTLIKGSIEVTFRNRPLSRIVLKPNQKLVIAAADTAAATALPTKAASIAAPQVNIQKPTYEAHTGAIIETSWTDNKLVFQDETFQDLATQMERWYGIAVAFDTPKLGELRFTGSFQKETIQQALEALQLTAQFKYIINGNQITIYER